MAQHRLDDLARDYGDALVSLEQFADLSGFAVSGLRSRSSRDDPGRPFPAPVNRTSRGFLYRLADLVGWSAPLGVGANPDPVPVAAWALGEANSRCAAAFGTDATQRVVGAAALAVAGGWRPHPDPEGAGPLLAQVRAVFRAARPTVPESAHLPLGFVPDPDPLTDPAVERELFTDLPVPSRTGRPTPLDLVVREVVRTWDVTAGRSGPSGVRAFVDAVERWMLPQRGDPRARGRATGVTETELAVALADVRPGQVVLDPATGSGNVLLEAVRSTATADGAQTVGVVGREQLERAWLFTKIRFGLRGIAHQLGAPGADSLTDPTLAGPFDRIVTDPDTGARSVRHWLRRVLELLTPDGQAVALFDASDLLPPRATSSQGWWGRFDPAVAALVLTSRSSSARSAVGFTVLRHDAGRPLLLAQAYPPPPGRVADPVDPVDSVRGWVGALAHVVRAGVSAPGSVDAGWNGNTFVTLMTDLTVEALGPVAWDDLEVVRRAKERLGGAVGSAGAAVGDVVFDVDPPAGDERVRAEALRAVRFLRSLIDPAVPPVEDPPVVVSAEDRLRYAADATHEMRRALTRLELRLTGEERRGRRPRSG